MEMTINGNLPAFSKDRIERRFSGDCSARNKLPILLQILTRSDLQVKYYHSTPLQLSLAKGHIISTVLKTEMCLCQSSLLKGVNLFLD